MIDSKKFIEKISNTDVFNNLESQILHIFNKNLNTSILKLPFSSKNLICHNLSSKINQIVIFVDDIQTVKETKVELNVFETNSNIICLEDFNIEIIQETLTSITNSEKFIFISPANIIKYKLPAKSELTQNTIKIEVGGDTSYDNLLEYLNLFNYNRDKFVENPGSFSVRGSIIDLWSFSEKSPIRLEYDGDFLESIRYFDPESQRSTKNIKQATIAASFNNDENTNFTNIFDYFDNPLIFASEYELSKLVESNVQEINQNDDLDSDLQKELFQEDIKIIEKKEITNVELISDNINSIERLLKIKGSWILEESIILSDNRIEHTISNPIMINANYELLFNMLLENIEQGNKIFITSENDFHAKRLYDLLADYDKKIENYLLDGKIVIVPIGIKTGFNIRDNNILVLTDYQLFNKPYRTKLQSKKLQKKGSGKELASIKKGEYVVHEHFGIGRYDGLETIKIGQIEQESLKLLYAEGGVVYVNLNYFSLIKKYSANENSTPQLSVLGSNEWKNLKKKVKKRIQEAARELIMLYAKRKATKGISYAPDTIWQKELEASFFYEDTPDQAKVTLEVKDDMESENPMDRLVCGDVGFGKTEIAVRAAFKAAIDGKQVAILVPTTILAEQHYNTFRDRLNQFPVKVDVMSRFRSKVQQNETLLNIREAKTDIVIGTHRLLSNDIKFKNLGLLIIDEEHRFGVMSKEKLRQYKANVDTLTLTATPIPRTLNMSLLGARDLSIIATPPPNRQPIYTKVDLFDIKKVRTWILDEVRRGGQIFFVHDRVQSIDKIYDYIKKHIPEIKIGIAHGQMKTTQLENVIYNFLNKSYDMLMATKIIESGIDIPNANTIIVNRADRFGLAELHQLRGRVGRSDKKAFAYFLVPSLKTITKKAVRRLQAIEEYSDVGEGFSLSMRDLEIRGAGNLLGTEQSGAINEVGFEMYVKLLDEAVEELKMSEFKDVFNNLPKPEERSEPTIDTFFEIGIPKTYMPEQADRLSYYTSLFSMKNIDEVDEIKDEIIDRYGKLPIIVERLILAAILRYYSSKALLERVIVMKDKLTLILPKGEREDFYKNKFVTILNHIMHNYSKNVRFIQDKELMKLVIENNYKNPEEMIKYLIQFCKVIINLMENQENIKIKEIVS